MPNLQQVIKVTQAQYDILASGGTVGDYTGLDSNYLYLIQDNNEYATVDYVDDAIADLATVARTGSYNDLSNKPTIPTVNNGTLTIQGNGTAASTFTANQSGNTTLNIKGSGATSVTRSADNEITVSSTHQSIKTLDTSSASTFGTNVSEAIVGSGKIYLHKVSKTGKLGDLNERTINYLREPDYWYTTPTPTAMARIDRIRANRFAGGLHPTSIICETSIDAGATWQSAGLSDNQKLLLMSNMGSVLYMPLKNGVKSTDCMARVTISGIEFNDTVKALSETERFAQMTPGNYAYSRVYASVQELYFWLSSTGDRIAIDVYTSKGNAPTTWTKVGSHPNANGWSGMDTIHLNAAYGFGGGSTQVNQSWFIRIIFRTCASDGSFDDSKLSQYTTYQQHIDNIMGYGPDCWSSNQPMGNLDRPYTYHGNNGTYGHDVYRWSGDLSPAVASTYACGTTSQQWSVVASRDFYENGTKLENKYLGKTAKAADSDKLDGNDSTYYLNYNNLTNKPSIPVDSNLVHKTGDETVNGTKTFSSIYLGSSGFLTTGGSTGLKIDGSNNTIYGHNGSDNTFKLSASETVLTIGAESTSVNALGTNTKYSLSNIVRTIKPTGTTTPTVYTYTYPNSSGTLAIVADIPTNILDGSGTNAIQEKMADATVNFAGRNSNAEALDPTISTTINTGATGNQSSAFGKNTMALATASFTNGNKTLAKGEESHAEGYQSVTLGNGSHAEGEATVSYGEVSHSEGSNTQSLGTASHAEGVRSKTLTISGVTDSGNAAHAEGESTIAAGYGSHTEGFGSYTGPIANAPSYPVTPEPEPSPTPSPTPVIEYGNLAHAEGNYCFAVGTGSHAEGYHTQALHEASHAEGVGTKTYRSGQLVAGWYNATPASNDLFVIGNGTADNARSNIFVVSLDGKVTAPTFVGDLTGNASTATNATYASSADNATLAQTANTVKVNPDSGYVGAILVNSDNNTNTVVRKDNITVTADGRLTVGHDPTNNMDVATKQYVDNKASAKLYEHNLILRIDNFSPGTGSSYCISVRLTNTTSTAYTTGSAVFTALYDAGYKSSTSFITASGSCVTGTTAGSPQYTGNVIGLYCTTSSTYATIMYVTTGTLSGTDFTIANKTSSFNTSMCAGPNTYPTVTDFVRALN